VQVTEMHAARRSRAQQAIAAAGVDAALITSLANVRYLSGLASSNAALLLPADGQGILATDSRYAGAAARDCQDLDLAIERDLEPMLVLAAAARGWRRLAFEAHVMTVERYTGLTQLADTPELVPLGPVVEQLRMVKDEAEITLLARACAITDEAFEGVLGAIRPGLTEQRLAVLLERAMVDLGAEGVAFATIVASGPNGAIPHHSPGHREFEPGDLITIDCGARFHGYHADMTRTVAVGPPASWQRDVYDLVATAQAAGVAAVLPGADVADVDATARDMIKAAGHGEHFQHGLGHGVGLEVHEAPMMGYGRTGKLEDRVCVTIEPGVYLPAQGGVRIEDTLVVRAGSAGAAPTGAAQTLTTTTRELLVL
jgi:Xaa-Pro aminopeptidase